MPSIICWVRVVPKPLLGLPTSQIRVPTGVPDAVHLPGYLLKSLGAADMTQVLGLLPPLWETQMELLAPGLVWPSSG